jgi:hypothetical protein
MMKQFLGLWILFWTWMWNYLFNQQLKSIKILCENIFLSGLGVVPFNRLFKHLVERNRYYGGWMSTNLAQKRLQVPPNNIKFVNTVICTSLGHFNKLTDNDQIGILEEMDFGSVYRKVVRKEDILHSGLGVVPFTTTSLAHNLNGLMSFLKLEI